MQEENNSPVNLLTTHLGFLAQLKEAQQENAEAIKRLKALNFSQPDQQPQSQPQNDGGEFGGSGETGSGTSSVNNLMRQFR